MFDRFNPYRFQVWKLLQLVTDMVLRGWLKFWFLKNHEVIFKFGGAKLCEFYAVSYGR